jgi:hypothetical protein
VDTAFHHRAIILIFLLALLLLALPFLIIYLIVTWDVSWWPRIGRRVPAFFEAVQSLPGLKVDVENKENNVYIDVK